MGFVIKKKNQIFSNIYLGWNNVTKIHPHPTPMIRAKILPHLHLTIFSMTDWNVMSEIAIPKLWLSLGQNVNNFEILGR